LGDIVALVFLLLISREVILKSLLKYSLEAKCLSLLLLFVLNGIHDVEADILTRLQKETPEMSLTLARMQYADFFIAA
jgi:hypothetical protein